MNLWIDDLRNPPSDIGWIWVRSVNTALLVLRRDIKSEKQGIEVISLDHDAGSFAQFGGDYIRVLDWLEETGFGNRYEYQLHTMNPVGRENMRRIIKKNKWREINAIH